MPRGTKLNLVEEIGASVREMAKKIPARDAAAGVILVVVLLVLGYVATTIAPMFSVNPNLVALLFVIILAIVGTIAIYVLRIWDKARAIRKRKR